MVGSGQKNNSSKSNSISAKAPNSASSQGGAVQQPIINQQSWPQIFIQQTQTSQSNQSQSSSQQKKNSAAVENIANPDSRNNSRANMENSEHSTSSQQQPQSPRSQQHELHHGSHNGEKPIPSDLEGSSNDFNFGQQRGGVPFVQPMPNQFGYSQFHGNNQPHQQKLPIQLCKNLDTKDGQLNFILEMQEAKNKSLTYQLYTHKERINEIEIESQQQKQHHAIRVNEYYEQATRYYDNFRQLETEMNTVSDTNEACLNQSFQILERLRGQMGNDQGHSLLNELEKKLRDMNEVNQKFVDEIDFRKEDEKTFIEGQDASEKAQEDEIRDSNDLKSQLDENSRFGATKQQMAQTQIQFSNLLIDMENVYGDDGQRQEMSSRYPQQVYNKLHDEIILFEESVKSIMNEMDPIKTIIIEKISNFIRQVIPNSEVEVYGSHATKLCLHWSDIDLVLKPNLRENSNSSNQGDSMSQFMRGRSESYQNSTSNSVGGVNMPNMRNWLNILFQELLKGENRGWLQKVDFIENTTVPVIKLACSFHHLSQNSNGQLLLPNGNAPRYPQIVSKPINVDITLWSENHNGPPCVNLVKSYIRESQLIEPLILVLKQMLKVWDFNDAYTGGLSSYALFLMIVSFLQEKRKPALKIETNLGETLLEFIRYYSQLDFSQYAICCKLPGDSSDKPNIYQNTNNEYSFFLQPRIVIDDPLMVNNNVGKSAFRFQEIKNIFGHAYNSAFTGCFCSCHLKSLIRGTNHGYHQGLMHQSQLGLRSGQQLRQAPNYLQFQYPPQFQQNQVLPINYNMPRMPAQEAAAQSPYETDPFQSSTQATTAPYPAAGASSMIPPLRTQSQPFQIDDAKRAGASAAQAFSFTPQATNFDMQCSCDGVLARLIYGYTNYRRTMESLHPNNNVMGPTAPLNNLGQNFVGGNQSMMGGHNSVIPNLPFMGGHNM